MKKFAKILCFCSFFLLMFFCINLRYNVSAEESSKMVYLGGENIGIKLNTGIEVIGKYEVETSTGKIAPWKSSNIKKGDNIISVEGLKVDNNQSLLSILNNTKKKEILLTIERDNKKFDTYVDVVISKNNQKSIGLYIKDKLLGIGTLTFVDPNSNCFASLGHGIYQDNELYSTNNGVILSSTVDSIRKATPGNAGEKKATLDNKVIGSISNNSITGLYGKVVDNYCTDKKLIEIGKKEDVHLGKAHIVTTLSSNKAQQYEIEIIETEIQNHKDIKGIKIKITDSRLINETGGIVQGMSGSPIIQDGKLVGAVSHVTVDNPVIGYGMYIEWMLEDAKISQK